MQNQWSFKAVHPVLPVKDVSMSLKFYEKLGFKKVFADSVQNPKYAGIQNDTVELHLQWHDVSNWETEIDRPMLRFLVTDIEAVFENYKTKNVFHKHAALRTTAWGTKEFAFYDPNLNGLTFYENL